MATAGTEQTCDCVADRWSLCISMINISTITVALKLQDTNCFPEMQVLWGEPTDLQKQRTGVI